MVTNILCNYDILQVKAQFNEVTIFNWYVDFHFASDGA